jgi:hypothetical protein
MTETAEMELRYKFANAPVSTYPFPHFFIRDVFPKDFYSTVMTLLGESVCGPMA